MHDVAQPNELERLGQGLVPAVKLQPMSSLGRGKLQSRQRIHRDEIGWPQPRDIQVDDPIAVRSCRRRRAAQRTTVVPGAPVIVISTSDRVLSHSLAGPYRNNLAGGRNSSPHEHRESWARQYGSTRRYHEPSANQMSPSAAGLLDELELHVVPVLLGDGFGGWPPIQQGAGL